MLAAIGAVPVQRLRLTPWPPTPPLDGWDVVEQGQRLAAIGAVGSRDADGQRSAVAIDDEGPLAKAAAARNAWKTATGLRLVGGAAETVVGLKRAQQGFFALQEGDTGRAVGYFGEATLRLMGVSLQTIQALKTAKATSVSRVPQSSEPEFVGPPAPRNQSPVRPVESPFQAFNPPLEQPPVGRSRMVNSPGVRFTRDAKDVAVNPRPPGASSDARSIQGVGRNTAQEALRFDLDEARAHGAEDIRVNQEQVNAVGRRVGINKPDLQYTLDGVRYYIEYDTVGSGRGPAHAVRTLANDPKGVVIIRTIPDK